jgi:hypothetical protein
MFHLLALLFVLLILSVPGVSALLLLHLHHRRINRFFVPRTSASETLL